MRLTAIAVPARFSGALTNRPSHSQVSLPEVVVEVGFIFAAPPKVFRTVDAHSTDVTFDVPPLNEVKLVMSWSQAFHLAEDLHKLCMSKTGKVA